MKKILIVVDTSRATGRKFLSGVEKYLSTLTDWEVYVQPPDYLQESASGYDFDFKYLKPDGLLIRDAFKVPELLETETAKVVSDTLHELIAGTSTIMTNSKNIGQMAADYFTGLGFYNFAYCGFSEFEWSQKRLQAFRRSLEHTKINSFYNYLSDSPENNIHQSERLNIAEWLKKLPRPICVFACNDDRAVSVLEACKIAEINVPEEIAVLGVDNDELICNLSSPPLSSIELDFERAGYSAAQHLNSLIENTGGYKIIKVSPLDIIERRSTDILAIDDEEVVSAIVFIRKNFDKPIQTIDVVEATCLSKRELEKRFKATLKRTIKSEIERLRINLVKNKLLNSSKSIHQIAQELKFTDPEHFSRYFRNATGQSPKQYRME
ncbi:XylR family transcriptional regulator [Sedimentisphaera salicampi]|uniref:Xylose operon regulatory protein n=1 Tax=Sedimentisphaera salicampi TaxID=1941349 RepID=A0A1W6LJ82_9BACT|nr:DNA-binding transcriptional regulator [Sedimentisphaera salicampi]ARN55815.1 Xylose operon regulatory protein [Sedimentisphaera salicampi]OXU16008.1 Xylose operon regulatory protein [Sedimentisphaera salicampi]